MIVGCSFFKILWPTLPPNLEKALNDQIKGYCRSRPYLKYIETYSLPLGPDSQPRPELFVADKLHFNEAGYKLLVERVRPRLPQ